MSATCETRRRGRPSESADALIQRIITRTGPALRLGDVARIAGIPKYNIRIDIQDGRLRGYRVAGGTHGFEYVFGFDDVRQYLTREGFVSPDRFSVTTI